MGKQMVCKINAPSECTVAIPSSALNPSLSVLFGCVALRDFLPVALEVRERCLRAVFPNELWGGGDVSGCLWLRFCNSGLIPQGRESPRRKMLCEQEVCRAISGPPTGAV